MNSVCRNKMYNLQFYSLTVTEPLNIWTSPLMNVWIFMSPDGWVELKGCACTCAAKTANTQGGAISTHWQFVIRNKKTWYYDHTLLFKLLVKHKWRKYQHCAFKSGSLEIEWFFFIKVVIKVFCHSGSFRALYLIATLFFCILQRDRSVCLICMSGANVSTAAKGSSLTHTLWLTFISHWVNL